MLLLELPIKRGAPEPTLCSGSVCNGDKSDKKETTEESYDEKSSGSLKCLRQCLLSPC